MATKAQKTQVGIFLLVGLTLIIVVFVIIARKGRKPTDNYFIKFEESVGGLKNDSVVLYKGVQVGKVRNIYVKGDNTIIVQVGIERELVTLREGTLAKLDLGNLMGGMVVELSGGDITSPRLKPGSYIPSEASVLENLAQDLPKILDDIKGILNNLNRALGSKDSDRVSTLLENANQTFTSSKKTLDNLTQLLQTIRNDLSDHGYELRKAMLAFQKAMLEMSATSNFLRNDPSSVMWGRSEPEHPYVR